MREAEEFEKAMQSVEDLITAPGLRPLPLKVYKERSSLLRLTCTDLSINTQVEVARHKHLLVNDRGEVGIEEVPYDFHVPQGQVVPLCLQQAVHKGV